MSVASWAWTASTMPLMAALVAHREVASAGAGDDVAHLHRLLVGPVLLRVEPVDADALGLGQRTGLVDVDDRPPGEVVVGGEDDRTGALDVDLVEAGDAGREPIADQRGAAAVEGAGEEGVVLRVAR